MAKTEDIEARLAAYVDGELDAAGRAELEKHLAANPQHRQLISELMQHRDFVRALPRESAPAEVAEAIHGQLERTVLLGDDDDSQVVVARIGYWPQLRAIAAVLVLTTSLAGIIYYLLPSPNREPAELARLSEIPMPVETSPPETSALVEADASAAARPPETTTTLAVAAAPQPAAERPMLAMDTERNRRAFESPAGGGGRGGAMSPIASNVMDPGERMFRETVHDEMTLNTPPSPVVYVISTDNPDATNREVTSYLRSNNYTWDAGTEPMPQPIQIDPQQQVALASRLQSQSVQLKTGLDPSQAAAARELSDKSQSGQQGAIAPALPQAQQAQSEDLSKQLARAKQNEQRIVVRGVSPQKAAEVRAVLDDIRARLAAKKEAIQEQEALQLAVTAPVAPAPPTGSFAIADPAKDQAASPAIDGFKPENTTLAMNVSRTPEQIRTEPILTMSTPTTLPSFSRFELGGVLPFHLPSLDSPGIDFKARSPQPVNPPISQALPSTQPAQAAPETTIGLAPTTLPARADFMDMVIVVLPEESAAPATQPAVPATLPAPQ